MNISIHIGKSFSILQKRKSEASADDAAQRVDFVVVQPDSDERQRTAISMLRTKTPVALIGIDDDSKEFLKFASATARRNHVPLVILGSWRYIPAVAALKEIVATQCLGELRSFAATHVDCFSNSLYINDLHNWLVPNAAMDEDTSPAKYDVRISIVGSHGKAKADFSLDGESAEMTIDILGHSRTRPLPKANPLVSELAVLEMSLKEQHRPKSLPLLMTFQ